MTSTAVIDNQTDDEKKVAARRAQFCTFRLGNMLFGVEVLCVQEVLLKQPMTRLPLTSPVIRGLINLRGQIVTAVDLRQRFGLESLDDDSTIMNVVVRTSDSVTSLVVDAIGDVVDVDATAFEAPPETLSGKARELILGAYKLDGKLLMVLDVERAASLDNVISD